MKQRIEYLSKCSVNDLISELRTLYPKAWNGSYPNLRYYIPLLNRIDSIFADHIKKYKLDQDVIEPYDVPNNEIEIITTCIDYSNQLLEYCKSKDVYNSHGYIADMMFSTSLNIKISALKMICCLSENFASHFPMKFALSAKHKNLIVQFIKSFPPQMTRSVTGPTTIEVKSITNPSSLNQSDRPRSSSISPEYGSSFNDNSLNNNNEDNPDNSNNNITINKKKHKKSKSKDSDLAHISLLDCFNPKFNVPSSWKELNFEYYQVGSTSSKSLKRSKIQKDKKIKKKFYNEINNESNKENDNEKEGLRNFKLSSEALKKLSIQQIFDKAVNVIPKDKWNDFILHVYTAIAYSGKSFECHSLRNKLVTFKCYAIAAAASNIPYNNFVGLIFDEEPYLLSYMCDLINPDNNVPRDPCIATLRSFVNISSRKNGASDLMRALGGNVSHGLLFHILKTILKHAKEGDFNNDQTYMNYIYNILANMLSTKSLASHLQSAGLMKLLLEFLTLRNNYRMTRSGPLHLIEIFIERLNEAFEEFVSNDGFNVIINLLEFEVQFAIDNPNYEGGSPKDADLSHIITARQVKLLDFLLRLVFSLITTYPGDRMRNLYDSPMLKSFIKILSHPKIFGYGLLYNTIRVITTIINNEPTAYSILNESGVIDTFFDKFKTFLLPNTKLLLELPDAINAISLNNAGLTKVKECEIIPQLFTVFKDVNICKELIVVENVMVLGHSIDELARHHPELKDIISEEILNLINIIPTYKTFNAIDFYKSSKGSLYHNKNEPNIHNEEGNKPLERWESSDDSSLVQCTLIFLSSILESSRDWKRLASKIDMNNLFQFIALTNAPFDYSLSKSILHFRSIIKSIDQNTRSYCLEFLIDKIVKTLENLHDFIYYKNDSQSYFLQFENETTYSNIARKTLSDLGVMNCLLFVLSDFYSKFHKYQQLKIADITEMFGSEKGLKLISSLCHFFRRLSIEEVILHYNTPLEVAKNAFTLVQSISPKQKEIGTPPTEECDWSGTSSKFKNISILYFHFSRCKFWLRNIFNGLCSINPSRRTETRTLHSRTLRFAISIIMEYTKTVFFILQKIDTDILEIKIGYSLCLLNQLHLNQFYSFGASAPHNVTMSVVLLQNENFAKLKVLALDYFHLLTQFNPESIKKASEKNYITIDIESLTISVLNEILQMYSDIGEGDETFNQNFLPNTDRLYGYMDAKADSYRSEVRTAINVQGSIANFALLQEILSDSGFNLLKNYMYIPKILIKDIINVSKAAYKDLKSLSVKFNGELYPISPDLCPPSKYNIEFILASDPQLTKEDAETILLFFNDNIESLKEETKDELKKNFVNEVDADWDAILGKEYQPQDIQPVHLKYSQTYDIHTIDDLSFHKSANENHFICAWLKLVVLYDELAPEIGNMFRTTFNTKATGMHDVLSPLLNELKALDYLNDQDDNSKKISSLFRLASDLVLSFSFERSNQFVGDFVDLMATCLVTENIEKKWFTFALTFMATIFCKTKVPFAPTAPKFRPEVSYLDHRFFPEDVFCIDSAIESQVLNLVLNLENIDSNEMVHAVSGIILILCSSDEQIKNLSNSKVLHSLIQFMKVNGSKSNYVGQIIMVIRRSYESDYVMKKYFEKEIKQYFEYKNKSKKLKGRDAKILVADNSSLIMLKPKLFCEVVAENCVIRNIDKKANVPLLTLLGEDDKNILKEYNMNALNKKKHSSEKTSDIMNFLLSELMLISRKDLFEITTKADNDIEKKDPKNKVDEINDCISSNSSLRYAAFLLHAIAELLFSYTSSKTDFLTFSKKSKIQADRKPRSTALNMIVHRFITINPFEKEDTVQYKVRELLASLGYSCILGLVSSIPIDGVDSFETKVDDDVAFSRKFTVDILMKIIKDTELSNKSSVVKYGKIVEVVDLVRKLCGESLGTLVELSNEGLLTKIDKYYFAKELIDKKFCNVASNIVAKMDMNFPHTEIVSESILKLFTQLGEIKVKYQDEFKSEAIDAEEEVFEDDDEDKDDAPDLLRNSTLGMYDLDEIEDEEDDFDDDFGDDEFLSEDGIEIILSDNDRGSDDENNNNEENIVEEAIEGEDIDDEMNDIVTDDENDDGMSSIEYDNHGIQDEQIDFIYDESDDSDDEMIDEHEVEDYVSNAEADFDDISDVESVEEITTSETGDEEDDGSIVELELDDIDEQENSDSDSDDSAILQEWLDELDEENPHRNGHRSRRGSSLFRSNETPMPAGRVIFPNSRTSIPLPMEVISETDPSSFMDLTQSLRRGTNNIDRLLEFRRVFEPLIFSNRNGRHSIVSIKSTIQRWEDSASLYQKKSDAYRCLCEIVNELTDTSMLIQQHVDEIKQEKLRKKKEKKEEERRQKDEAERVLLERMNEEMQNSENNEHQDGNGNENNTETQNEITEPVEPVYVEIGGQSVDISGTGIDPEFMLALPDDMRQEVYEQHLNQEVIQRRNRAVIGTIRESLLENRGVDGNANDTNTSVSHQSRDLRNLNQLFLSSLRRGRVDGIIPTDFDENVSSDVNSDFDDEGDDEGDDDDEEDEDEEDDYDNDENDDLVHYIDVGNSEGGAHNRRLSQLFGNLRSPHLPRGIEMQRSAVISGPNAIEKPKKSSKIYFTALVDKAGVAALLKLLFIPQVYFKRELFFKTVSFLCLNKHSRAELIAIILYILQEALKDQNSLAYVYNQVCIKANVLNKDINDFQPAIDNSKITYAYPSNCNPVALATQCIDVIQYLLENESSMRFHFVTDQEGIFFMKRSKKNKLKDNSYKFPINVLLNLLENKIIKEDTNLMDILSRSIQIATRPLPTMKSKLDKIEKEKDIDNVKKLPQLPCVPDKSLKNIINILVADECANKVFQQTIVSIQNLSVLDNAKIVFPKELSKRATHLSSKIIKELRELINDLKDSKRDIEDIPSLSQFSSGASDQAKLLRILTALDYLYQTKDKDVTDDIEELKSLYKNSALGPLWGALSDCLKLLSEDDNMNYIAFILSPLIEALMVVCKHSKVQRMSALDVLKYKEEGELDFAKEPIESLFFTFTEEHKKILNHMIRNNPKLMSGPFQVLIRNSRVLEFDNKRVYFEQKLHDENPDETREKISVNIRRNQVFLDSYRSIFFKPSDKIKKSILEIKFNGEEGVDAGGVTREWYQVLSRQIFDPNYALFIPVASDKTTFHPNRTSWVNPEHLSFFKFVGMIIGKAVYDGYVLDCHFSRAVFKRLLGKSVSLKDMESLDLDYYKSLVWMLENDITDIIVETFSVETDDYGEHKIIDLIPNGRHISVTEENKQEYVKSIIEYRLLTSVKEQMDNFLEGFYSMIPKDLISIFDEQELELLVSGLPEIDVDDWKNNTIYENYSASSPQVQWFWRAVKSFDDEERAKLLQFATGTSKVPLNGFKELTGMNGISKFSIHRVYKSSDRLPTAHTCFNQIDLPEYENYTKLRSALLLAIREGHEGFGFA